MAQVHFDEVTRLRREHTEEMAQMQREHADEIMRLKTAHEKNTTPRVNSITMALGER
jgi:hypothetical protein